MIESENNLCFIQGRRKKKNILRKRLPLSPSPPPLMVNLLCFCFGVLLTLYYDYMCSETDFTKVNSHATTEIPNSSSYCCCPLDDHLHEAGPSF